MRTAGRSLSVRPARRARQCGPLGELISTNSCAELVHVKCWEELVNANF